MNIQLHIYLLAYNRPKSLKRVLDSLSRTFSLVEMEVNIELSLDFGYDVQCLNQFESFRWSHGAKSVWKSPNHLGVDLHTLSCFERVKKDTWNLVVEDDHYSAEGASALIQFLINEHPPAAAYGLHAYPLNPINELPFIPLKKEGDFYAAKRCCSRGMLFHSKQIDDFNRWRDGRTKVRLHPEDPSYIISYGSTNWETIFTKYLLETDQYLLFPFESVWTVFGERGVHMSGVADRYDAQTALAKSRDYVYRYSENHSRYDEWIEYELTEEEVERLNTPGIKSISCDIWGNRSSYHTSHVITSKKPENAIQSFALELKPAELNFLENVEGSALHLALADQVGREKKSDSRRRKELYRSYFNQRYSLSELVHQLFRRIFSNRFFSSGNK